MIINGLYAKGSHYLIKHLCCCSFKEGILFPVISDTVYNILAFMEFIYHFFHHSRIILQIRINGDHDIRMLHGIQHTCRQCILMSHITGKFQSEHLFFFFMKFSDQFPCAVFASVIHI